MKDVCIDSIGAFGGILTVRLICWLFLTPARVAKRQEAYAYRKMKQDGALRENATADIKFYIDQIPKLPDSEDFLGDRFSTRKFSDQPDT